MLLQMPHNFIAIELRHEPFLLLLSLSDNINNIWLFRLIVVHHYFVIGNGQWRINTQLFPQKSPCGGFQ